MLHVVINNALLVVVDILNICYFNVKYHNSDTIYMWIMIIQSVYMFFGTLGIYIKNI
jgi:hypothetical protein